MAGKDKEMSEKVRLTKPTVEELENITESIHYAGKEYVSTRKLFVKGDVQPHMSLDDRIKRIFRQVSMEAEAQGIETFDEANDFDIDDDVEEMITDYELADMTDEFLLPKEDKKDQVIDDDLSPEDESVIDKKDKKKDKKSGDKGKDKSDKKEE